MPKLVLQRHPEVQLLFLRLDRWDYGLYNGCTNISNHGGFASFKDPPLQEDVITVLRNLDEYLASAGPPDVPLCLYGEAPGWVYGAVTAHCAQTGRHVHYIPSLERVGDQDITIYKPMLHERITSKEAIIF